MRHSLVYGHEVLSAAAIAPTCTSTREDGASSGNRLPAHHHTKSIIRARAAERGASSGEWTREAIFDQLKPLISRLVRKYSDSVDAQSDVQGEIYCRFCQIYGDYDPERGVPLLAYLINQLKSSVYSDARRRWNIEMREKTGGNTEMVLGSLAGSADPTDTWDTEIAKKQVMEQLPGAFARLTQRQRSVVIWRYYEQRSFEEIAEILNVKASTARSLLRHGLSELRKQLEQFDVAF